MSGRCALHIPALSSCCRCGEVGLIWWTSRFLYHVRYRKAEIQHNRYLKNTCDGPAGRKLQPSSLQRCSAAGAGQHVDRLLIISLPFLPKIHLRLSCCSGGPAELQLKRGCRGARKSRFWSHCCQMYCSVFPWTVKKNLQPPSTEAHTVTVLAIKLKVTCWIYRLSLN